MARAYGFDYDDANWLTKADFTQLNGSLWDNSAKLDFSVNGRNGKIEYDENGNILSMLQMGWKPAGSVAIVEFSTPEIGTESVAYRIELILKGKISNILPANLGKGIEIFNAFQIALNFIITILLVIRFYKRKIAKQFNKATS